MALSVCAVSILLMTAGQVPPQPDFSGRWVLLEPASPADVPPVLVVQQQLRQSDVWGKPLAPFWDLLLVEGDDSRGGIRSGNYHIGGVSGSVGGGPVGADWTTDGPTRRTEESVRWDGHTLVITTQSWMEREKGTREDYEQHAEVWRIDAVGQLVITVTEKRGGRDSGSRTITYRKEQAR